MDTDLQARIERLYENESLTDNLTDAAAKTLLHWAEQQLCDNTDETLVVAAVGFANTCESTAPDAILTQAQTFLTEQLHSREITLVRPATGTDPSPEQISNPPSQSALSVSGASGTAAASDARLIADAGAATAPPVKKKRRARKQKSK